MSKIKIIKKVKANLVRFKIHKLFGKFADLMIYAGYLLKMSAWIDQNKSKLSHNDFYNGNVNQHDRERLYAFLSKAKDLDNLPITYLEFGVGRGNSMKWWTQHNSNVASIFWGFDTFEGLPEKYGTYEIGTFSLEGNYPDIKDQRINFIKGLFQDTLLESIPKVDFNKQVILHVDGDLYSSALFTLTMLYPYLKVGDLIIFDEFVVPYHEFKAFDDFVKSFYIDLAPIGAINNYLQMVFEIKKIRN